MVNRVMSVSERPAHHRPAVRDSGEFPNSGFRHSELGSGREGVVIPGTYKNIHGEIVKIDPKTLDPNTEVMRF